MKQLSKEEQPLPPLQPLNEFPRDNIRSPNGIPGVRVIYQNSDGQRFAVDVTSANPDRVAAYINMARLACQGTSIEASERTLPPAAEDGTLTSTLEKAMADVLYYGKHAFLYSEPLAQLIEESGQQFIDLLRKIGDYDLNRHARSREQIDAKPQDFESLERDIRSILERQVQANDENRDPSTLNITLNWLDAPHGFQRVNFAVDPTVTYFKWNRNANPPYDINSVDSYRKFGVTFVSASVSTLGGSVDVTLLRGIRSEVAVAGPTSAPASLAHSSDNPVDYRLRIRGTSYDPNKYSITGSWEE